MFTIIKYLANNGFASDGETWTKSREDSFAASSASSKGTKPLFSPLASTRRTSLALILSFIGTIFFLVVAIANTYIE